MSSEIQCRQCGILLPRSNFPTGEFKCPDCNWTQLLSPSGRSRLRKPKKKDKPARALATAESTIESSPDGETVVAAPAELVEAPDLAETLEPVEAFEPGASVILDGEGTPAPEPVAGPARPESPPRGLAPLPVLDLEGLRALTCADFRLWCTALLCRFGYTTDGEAPDGHLELVRGGERILVDCIAFSERENVGRPEAQKLVDGMEERQIARGMLLSPGSFENGCRALTQRSETTRIQLVDGERLEQTAREIANGPLAAWWS